MAIHEPPALPAQASSDGREIWAWGHGLSAYAHWLDAKRRLRQDIIESTGVCGSCNKWMKSRECPREHNVNGMSRGPSCKATACGQFVWQPSSLRFVEERKATLAALEADGPNYGPALSGKGA